MMDEEKFNTELKRRIAEVFDNYEDTGADEGWALLRQKFPVKEKDRGPAWYWYAAAAVALLVMGIWFMQKPAITNNNQAVNPVKQTQPGKNTNTPIDSVDMQRNPVNGIAKIDSGKNIGPQLQNNGTQIVTVYRKGGKNSGYPIPGIEPFDHTASQQGGVQSGKNNNAIASQKNNAFDLLANKGKTDSPAVNKGNAAIAAIDRPIVKTAAADSQAIGNTTQVIAQQPALPKTNSAQAMADLLNQKVPENRNKADKQNTAKKASISLYAATYFNYATGSDNQLNVGAGFTSDFKISGGLKLSTGIAVGQNSLSYNNSAAPSNLQYAAAVNDSRSNLSGAIGTSTAQAGGANLYNNTNANVTQVNKKYQASLMGLDIPINFKYQFSPKSDTYVLAGVSSGTYITETYKTTSTTSLVTQESTMRSSFSSFDFAKTLNFSFGVGYPLGKTNRLIIEPFLKYPLDGLGAQQIKFGAGGINLKLNFQSPKK